MMTDDERQLADWETDGGASAPARTLQEQYEAGDPHGRVQRVADAILAELGRTEPEPGVSYTYEELVSHLRTFYRQWLAQRGR